MIKYLILDMGKVLVYPETGSWFITPIFLKNVDITQINREQLKKALIKYSVDNEKMENLDEEYNYIKSFYEHIFKEIGYEIDAQKIKEIVDDYVFNLSDTKCYLYDDVKTELDRLSKKYTLIMLSDNLPSGMEYLEKHDIKKYFTKIYFSCYYGKCKCDKTLFDYPITDFNIQKGEAIFVDDKESLLDIAVEKGLDVILMDRNKECEKSKYKIINDLKSL